MHNETTTLIRFFIRTGYGDGLGIFSYCIKTGCSGDERSNHYFLSFLSRCIGIDYFVGNKAEITKTQSIYTALMAFGTGRRIGTGGKFLLL